jgi:hypothetical protein
MNIVYDNLADRTYLKGAAEKRAGDIKEVFGPNDAVEVSWVFRPEATPRELVLVARDQERQAEEPITSSELHDGDGPFTNKLKRMRDALAHNGAWRIGVRNLMTNVRAWCQALPNTATEDYTVALNEERSGRYMLPALRVRRNGRTLSVKPVAEWFVPPLGSEREEKVREAQLIGRSDLDGPFDSVPLYLLSSGQWIYQANKLYPDSVAQLFGNLDESAFLALIGKCMDD